jgi:hypothetical protein
MMLIEAENLAIKRDLLVHSTGLLLWGGMTLKCQPINQIGQTVVNGHFQIKKKSHSKYNVRLCLDFDGGSEGHSPAKHIKNRRKK